MQTQTFSMSALLNCNAHVHILQSSVNIHLFINRNHFTTLRKKFSHLVVEVAVCVEAHAGVEPACACNAGVIIVTDDIQHLRYRVLLHSTGNIQPKVRLACDLSVIGGVGTETVGVHNSAILKLFQVEDIEINVKISITSASKSLLLQ